MLKACAERSTLFGTTDETESVPKIATEMVNSRPQVLLFSALNLSGTTTKDSIQHLSKDYAEGSKVLLSSIFLLNHCLCEITNKDGDINLTIDQVNTKFSLYIYTDIFFSVSNKNDNILG